MCKFAKLQYKIIRVSWTNIYLKKYNPVSVCLKWVYAGSGLLPVRFQSKIEVRTTVQFSLNYFVHASRHQHSISGRLIQRHHAPTDSSLNQQSWLMHISQVYGDFAPCRYLKPPCRVAKQRCVAKQRPVAEPWSRCGCDSLMDYCISTASIDELPARSARHVAWMWAGASRNDAIYEYALNLRNDVECRWTSSLSS